MWGAAWAWLKDNNDQLGAVASILGVLIGVVGFGLTIWQLSSAAKTLQAQNTYEIQRDARDLVEKLKIRGYLDKLIGGSLPPADLPEAQTDLWRMFNFYIAVYRQSLAGGVSRSVAASFGVDFCGLVSRPPVAAEWQKMLAAKKLGQPHVNMKEAWCDANP